MFLYRRAYEAVTLGRMFCDIPYFTLTLLLPALNHHMSDRATIRAQSVNTHYTLTILISCRGHKLVVKNKFFQETISDIICIMETVPSVHTHVCINVKVYGDFAMLYIFPFRRSQYGDGRKAYKWASDSENICIHYSTDVFVKIVVANYLLHSIHHIAFVSYWCTCMYQC